MIANFIRGKSGLHRAGRQVTPGKRELTDSATENIPLFYSKGEKVR
tara:strand:- start:67 stop:204 length:138 start_codon:yes stop_codon:yes gene_type:complete